MRVIRAAGITAMATAAAAGPLMVAGLLDFNAETPVWAVSVLLIFGWAALVSRMLAGTGTFRPNKARCNRTLTPATARTSQGRAAQADAAATGGMSFTASSRATLR